MRVLVCGKGGSGKSTVAALLARLLVQRGWRVLVVDMDESNQGLHRFLGLTRPVEVLDDLGGKAGLREKLKPAFPGAGPGPDLLKNNTGIDDLPVQWRSQSGGLSLLAIGKIHDFAEGCACPMGALARLVLSRLALGPKDIVIVDTSAGVEHFGRSIDGLCDLLVAVVDPTYESLTLAQRLESLAAGARTDIRFVFNKVGPQVESIMEERFASAKVVARVGYDQRFFMAGLEGKAIDTGWQDIAPLCRLVEDHCAT